MTYGILRRFIKGTKHFQPDLLSGNGLGADTLTARSGSAGLSGSALGYKDAAICLLPKAYPEEDDTCLKEYSSSLTSSTAKRGSMSFKMSFPAVLLLSPSFNQDSHNHRLSMWQGMPDMLLFQQSMTEIDLLSESTCKIAEPRQISSSCTISSDQLCEGGSPYPRVRKYCMAT